MLPAMVCAPSIRTVWMAILSTNNKELNAERAGLTSWPLGGGDCTRSFVKPCHTWYWWLTKHKEAVTPSTPWWPGSKRLSAPSSLVLHDQLLVGAPQKWCLTGVSNNLATKQWPVMGDTVCRPSAVSFCQWTQTARGLLPWEPLHAEWQSPSGLHFTPCLLELPQRWLCGWLKVDVISN